MTATTRRKSKRNQLAAGEVADRIEWAVEGASYSTGATALMVVLARWIAERGERPVLDGEVYGRLLETVVGCMVRAWGEEGEVSDVAA